MLPSLLVAAAMTAPGAPVPKDTVPNTTGPAPRVVAVKAEAGGAGGAVWITAHVYQMQKVQQQYAVNENGATVVKTREVEQMTSNYVRKPLADFGGKFVTAGGTPLTAEDATLRVKDGATLLITADGKPVDKGWLKAVADDTVIMATEGLGTAHFVAGYGAFPSTAAPRLVMLGTDDKGDVRVPVNPNAGNLNGNVYYDDFNGGRVRGFRGKMVIQDGDFGGVATPSTAPTPAGADGKKSLSEIKFDAYDVTGKLVQRSEALTRLKAGGMVIVAGDNRFPDATHLQAFREDMLVIVSSELVFQPGQPNPFDRATSKPAAPAGPQPANQPLIQVAPAIAGPAVIKRVQIQIER